MNSAISGLSGSQQGNVQGPIGAAAASAVQGLKNVQGASGGGSSDVIKMDFAKMEAMIQTFRKSSQQLQDTSEQMRNIARTLENGALIGQGGTAFEDAINSKLLPAIQRLNEKFEEMAKDVEKAMQDMKQADSYSRQQFQD